MPSRAGPSPARAPSASAAADACTNSSCAGIGSGLTMLSAVPAGTCQAPPLLMLKRAVRRPHAALRRMRTAILPATTEKVTAAPRTCSVATQQLAGTKSEPTSVLLAASSLMP
jgi:hypothetical protein